MNRLDLIPSNDFVSQFKKANSDVIDIKNAQRVGRDVLKPKIVEVLSAGTPTVFDLHTSMQAFVDFKAVFVADHQENPWATVFYKTTIGTIDNPPAGGDIAGFSYIDFDELGPGKIGYIGFFGANMFGDNRDIWLKVYFYATDTGVLTVTAI